MTDKKNDPSQVASDKFNEIMPETTDRVICIKVDRPISVEGYEHNFLPLVHKMIEQHGELRILVYYDNFKGWEYEAAKNDMVTFATFGNVIKKIALVAPPESEVFRRSLKMENNKGEFKFYNKDELNKALEWVGS